MSTYVALVNLVSGQKVVVDANGLVRTLLEGEQPKAGEVVLGQESAIDHDPSVNVELFGEDGSTQDISDDIEEIFAALEQGQDPTQLGDDFATAAGQQVSSSVTQASTIVRNGVETLASTEFSTEGFDTLSLSETQSLSILTQYQQLQQNVVSVDTNSNPDGLDLTLITPEDQPLSGQLSATDSDGDELSFSEGDAPSNGSLIIDESGNWTYTPTPDFNGNDSFTVIVSDGNGGTDEIIVNIGVTPINDNPVLVDKNGAPLGDDLSVSTQEDTPVSGKVNATDVDGDDLTYTVNDTPTNGSVSIDAEGNWTYSPDEDFHGSDNFTITVDDGNGGVDTVTINLDITEQNDGPTIEVTAEATFNENDAVVGTKVASFDAKDEEDGTPSVTFTPGTNTEGYYEISGTDVVLTAKGVEAINAGTSLPAVNLTATDSDNATASDSATPSYVEQNDGPTIEVTAEATFNENDAVVGTKVASFDAKDEEDGTPSVTFTPGTNTEGYYEISGTDVVLTAKGVEAINAGTSLPAVNLTATDSDNATASDSATPSYVEQNDGPTIEVTAEATFNENDAVVGTKVASFDAKDEEDGTPSVTFTPGTNTEGYYEISGTDVVLTAKGVEAINAGTSLPAVNLTATDSDNATASDSATPSYVEQNDGPTIEVTAEATFNENDAVVGTKVASFDAKDEEDGTPSVTFTPGTNTEGYYEISGTDVVLTAKGVEAINAGTSLPAVNLTATDSDNATASDSATPSYVEQNDGPTIEVTAEATFNENDAVVGTKVASFDAKDEEDGTPSVTFTPGTNTEGYYEISGTDVVLTAKGVEAINAGTSLPAVNLTATDSDNATASDSATPSYVEQNDGPTIEVTAEATFNENDAVVGTKVASFDAKDEEDGTPSVTFTPGTNTEGYYEISGTDVVLTAKGVEAINAGTSLPAVNLTATDSDNATASDSATPSYVEQNDGPTIEVTAEATFNENDAVVGTKVASFDAKDEEDGTPSVTFTPGTNTEGYYEISGTDVVLTAKGVEAINAGTSLPAVNLTATDSDNATASDSATPSYVEQNDGPTIEVTAEATFNENDAVVGTKVASFDAKDEEDGTPSVTFTPGTNTEGYYEISGTDVVLTAKGVEAINAGTSLPAVNLTATDSDNATASDSATPSYVEQNDGPTIEVTAEATFNENDAVVGTKVASFDAKDEEDGTPSVTFTPGTNTEGYYEISGTDVVLTAKGVEAINAGTSLPAVNLTATDSDNATASDSATPSYVEQNDGPTIEVTAEATFNENDAVVGTKVASFDAKDEEDGTPSVTFTPGTNTEGYYEISGTDVVLTAKGVEAINAGTSLPAVNLTATDSDNATASDSATPSYVEQNDGPTIEVTAEATFNENDAVVGTKVASFDAKDEEDGTPSVTFTPGTNTEGYYEISGTDVVLTAKGVEAINAGTSLPAVNLTATDSDNATASDSATPSYVEQNDGPTIEVTAEATFNENDAVVGTKVASFDAKDEEDGTPSVTFTPGTNTEGYYEISGTDVVLTAKGVEAINAGTSLPAVNLTATDSDNATASDSATPSYVEQNDGPTIEVTAEATFNENDAVVGTKVASFDAKDEEDGTPSVTFTPGTNTEGYYEISGTDVVLTAKGVEAINAGTSLPAVNLTATDSDNATASDSATPSYVEQNDGPTIEVTAEATFNENDAVVGTKVASFDAKDEEDGTPSVTFTPGTNTEGYYEISGTDVVLTAKGVEAINAGTSLPAVNLTATDSDNATASDSATPSYVEQNDGPTIEVTAEATFNENDAVVGTKVASFDAKDEEDGTPSVTFTPGTNTEGYYEISGTDVVLTAKGVEAINAGTSLPAVNLTATDSDNATASDSATPSYVEQNDGPTTSPVTLTVSEDTHYFFSSDDFVFNDPEGDDFVSVTIESLPQSGILQFEGQPVVAGQTITSQELGQLTFKPAHNESGDNYVQFDFSVSDGELSSEIQTLTFDVLPITDGLSVSASLQTSGSHISDSIIEEQLENLSKLTPSTSPTNGTDYLVTDGNYDVSSLNGDDYILSTEQPSDERLVGAEGDDVIIGGASNTQQLYGDDFGGTIAGNDILIGGDSANNVDFYAGLGDDVLIAQDKYATTAYYGSEGIDTAYVPGKLSDYNFTKGSGSASSYDFQLIPKDHDNTHQFYDVEYVVFEDGKYSVEDGELVKTHNIYELSIDVNLHDDDGSEQLVSVIISDVPEGVEIHNASKLPDDSWSVDVSDFSGGEVTLKVESPVDINPIFTVSATAQEFEDGQWVDVPKTATAQTGSVFVSSVDPNGDNKVEGGSGDDVLVGDIGGYVNSVTPGVNYNIALVVDTSGSMGDYVRDSQGYIQLNPDNTYMTRMDMMQQALKNLVTSFASHDGVVNVSLIGFDDNIDVSFPVMDLRENSSSFYELLNKIEGNLPVGGGTDYDVGFSEANNWFGSRDILSNGYENMTLFLTDGEPYTSSVDDALAEFDKLTNTYNSEVLAIGMGSDISTDYLKFFDNTNVVSLEKVPGMESSYDVFSFSNRYNLEGQEYTTGNGDVYVSGGDLVLKADHGYAKWESSKFEISKDSSDLNFEVKMWKSDFSWELFDSNGIRVDSGQLSGSGKKDISSEGLKAGSYTLVLTHVGESGWYGSYAYLDEVSITEYVFANVGDVQIAATPDELEAALQGSETIKEIANMGSDQVFGNEGNDVLFGDSINSDFLPWGVNGNPEKPADFEDGSGLAGLKTFLELKNGTEPTDLDIYDFVKENHQIFDIEGDNRGSGDIVDGGPGDDVLYGQGGSDTLIGGVGNDILTGGEDADIFTWLDGDLDGSTDSIKDFDVAEGDKIDLSDLFADATADDVTTILNNISDSVQDTENGVSIKVESSVHEHVTIELDGLSAADITNNLDNIFIIKD